MIVTNDQYDQLSFSLLMLIDFSKGFDCPSDKCGALVNPRTTRVSRVVIGQGKVDILSEENNPAPRWSRSVRGTYDATSFSVISQLSVIEALRSTVRPEKLVEQSASANWVGS